MAYNQVSYANIRRWDWKNGGIIFPQKFASYYSEYPCSPYFLNTKETGYTSERNIWSEQPSVIEQQIIRTTKYYWHDKKAVKASDISRLSSQGGRPLMSIVGKEEDPTQWEMVAPNCGIP